MKNLIVSLTIFNLISSVISPWFHNPIYAENLIPFQNNYYESSWSENDEFVFFDIEISKGLNFFKNYYTAQLINGLSCEIIFTPSEETAPVNEKGVPLNKIVLDIQAYNSNVENVLDYKKILKKIFITSLPNGSVTTQTVTITDMGTLQSKFIDLTQPARFFTIEGNPNQGFIAFKKSGSANQK